MPANAIRGHNSAVVPRSTTITCALLCSVVLTLSIGCDDSSSSSGRPQGGQALTPAPVAPAAPLTPQPGAVPPGSPTPLATPPAVPTPAAVPPAATPPAAGAAAPPPAADACGADPTNAGDGICPGGLICGDPTGTSNFACMCPSAQTMLPPCTMGGTECAVFAGTTCSNLFGMQGCHKSCTPAGAAPVACPDPLQCADPLGTGVTFCVMSGQITPPACTVQADCDIYAGTFCMDPLGLGILGCVKSCALGARQRPARRRFWQRNDV